MLEQTDIDRIADAVVLKLRVSHAPTSDVLTRAEAKSYVKKPGEKSFDRWRKKWGVRRKGHGRYSLGELDLALAREAGTVRTPASLRRKAA